MKLHYTSISPHSSVVKNKTIIGLKYPYISLGYTDNPVKNKTIIGLKYNKSDSSLLFGLLKIRL